jgi:integrase/recombinase XerD
VIGAGELDPQGLEALARAYVAWAEATRGASPDSTKSMTMRLRRFVNWCTEREITRPSDVTTAVLERYQRSLFHYRKKDGQPLRRKTQNLYLIEVRSFFRWLKKQGRLHFDPAADLELMKVEKALLRHVLKADEVDQVLNTIDTTHPAGLRDRAILELLYSTGVRRAEAVRLRIVDLDVERGTVMVRLGKGKKDRVVPIGERAIAWVVKYLDDVRPLFVPATEDDGTLFLSDRGRPLAADTLTKIGRRRIEESGLYQKGDACHVFRHSAATAMLRGGADIRHLAEFLGHAQLTTTQIYTQVTVDDLKAVHTATHPAANLTPRPMADGDEPEA